MKKYFYWLAAGSLVLSATLFAETKILAFSGSLRSGYNQKLVEEAAAIAREMGATVTVINLKDFPIPFYDADYEKNKGMPENAKRLRTLMKDSNAIIIASPEYNHSVSGVLKNALDWASRSENGRSSREAFYGKKFAIMCATPGKEGGAIGLSHLQAIIDDVGGKVVPKEVIVRQAHQAFNAKGELISPEIRQELQEEIQQLVN